MEYAITRSRCDGIPLCEINWQNVGARRSITVPPLGENEIHIWFVPLTGDAADLAAGRAILNEREQARAARFKFDLHRNRFILSRSRFRELIAGYANLPVMQLDFQTGRLGKPFLAEKISGRELSFNNSDSQDYSLIAVAWDCELGIDLECFSRHIKHADKIMEHHFTPAEIETVNALSKAEPRDAFLAAWTSKEAFGKAEGVGIRYAMGEHAVAADLQTPAREIKGLETGKRDRWRAVSFALPIDAVGTVVYDAKNDLHLQGLSLA